MDHIHVALPDTALLVQLTKRYGQVTLEALTAVLCPLWIPVNSISRRVYKETGQNHWRATFSVRLDEHSRQVLVRGCTGKFVPGEFVDGERPWKEIAKGRIISVDEELGISTGEIYSGDSRKGTLEAAVGELSDGDYLEIDQYGASAKILSALAEYEFTRIALSEGFAVKRMPEDTARHLGAYRNYDFELSRGNQTKRVEAKSLWGTDTRYARLIHSKSTSKPAGPETSWTTQQIANYYPTSSCKYTTQDIFAVCMFLRTGKISDFAFAKSVPDDIRKYGLPRSSKYPDHVNQNPLCEIGNGAWFSSISEVWDLE